MKSSDKLPGGEALAQRVNDALRVEFISAGRGAIARTQRRMGVSDAYFRNLRPEALTFATLGAALDALEVDQSHFFSKVFSSELDPVEQFRRTLGNGDPAELPIVRRFREQLALGGCSATSPDGEESIEELDARRYDAPEEVCCLAAARIERGGDAGELIGLLGVWASAQRVLCNHQLAVAALSECIQQSSRLGNDRMHIISLGKAAVVARSSGQSSCFELLSDRSLGLAVAMGDDCHAGMFLVSRGLFLYEDLREYGHGARVLRSSLPRLRRGNGSRARMSMGSALGALSHHDLCEGRFDGALVKARAALGHHTSPDGRLSSVQQDINLGFLVTAQAAKGQLQEALLDFRRTCHSGHHQPTALIAIASNLLLFSMLHRRQDLLGPVARRLRTIEGCFDSGEELTVLDCLCLGALRGNPREILVSRERIPKIHTIRQVPVPTRVEAT